MSSINVAENRGKDYPFIGTIFINSMFLYNKIYHLNSRCERTRNGNLFLAIAMSSLNRSSTDKDLLEQLTKIVLANLGNEHFGAEELAIEAGISRSRPHRKLQSIIAKPASRFIREIRLQEALKLLDKKVYTASEVVYMVGFTSPNYFNKCFLDHFGYPPGEVKHRKIKDGDYGNGIKLIQKSKKFTVPSKPWQIGIAGLAVFIIAIAIYLLFKNMDPISTPAAREIQKSIALLPLENISDVESDYLAGGIESAIANTLRNVPGIKLCAGVDVDQLVSQNLTKKEIGKRLGVAFILEGTIWKEGKRFQLSLILTDIKTDEILWNDSFDKEFDLVMNVASEVVMELSKSVQVELTSGVRSKINHRQTSSLEAYDLNMRAWEQRKVYFGGITTNKDSVFNISNQLALKALEYDSNYVEPLACIVSNEFGLGNIDTAKIMADYMIKKYTDLPNGYSLKAGIYFFSRSDYDKSLELYQKAYRIDPNDY